MSFTHILVNERYVSDKIRAECYEEEEKQEKQKITNKSNNSISIIIMEVGSMRRWGVRIIFAHRINSKFELRNLAPIPLPP